MKHDSMITEVGVGHAIFVSEPSVEPRIPYRTADAELGRHERPASAPHVRVRDEQVQTVIHAPGLAHIARELQSE